MQKTLRLPQIIILMVAFSFLSVAAVVFTPAYPELAQQFHLSSSQAQWMMTLFLFGTAIGRLPYGPLANRYGRKPTLFLGLFISLIGTIITIFAQNYPLICVGRFIQAIGCSVTLKISYTMIGDLHVGSAATKILAFSMLIYAILPGIGTAISGFLTPYLGWRGGFLFFLVFTLLFIGSCLALPETIKKKDRHALKMKRIIHGYLQQFKNLYLILWSCLMGLSTAVIFIFSQEAPFVAIESIGLSPSQYGLFYLVPAFGIAGGSLCTAWLADRLSPLTGMLIGILTILGGSLFMGVCLIEKWINGWSLFLPQTIIQFGDALLYTFASSQGLTEAKDKSNASAIMLFINSLGAVVGTFLVGTLSTRSFMTLTLTFLSISCIMLIVWMILWFHRRSTQLEMKT
jgi:DHA1 family bicyclomycin/chloramphenicol resistance-like MFS transporter